MARKQGATVGRSVEIDCAKGPGWPPDGKRMLYAGKTEGAHPRHFEERRDEATSPGLGLRPQYRPYKKQLLTLYIG